MFEYYIIIGKIYSLMEISKILVPSALIRAELLCYLCAILRYTQQNMLHHLASDGKFFSANHSLMYAYLCNQEQLLLCGVVCSVCQLKLSLRCCSLIENISRKFQKFANFTLLLVLERDFTKISPKKSYSRSAANTRYFCAYCYL